MKRILLTAVVCLSSVLGTFAQMSDQQVMDFIASEAKAGTSQSQIVTRLIQRGVKIDQIRRLRNQYDSQIKSRGMSKAADGAVTEVADRMQGNGDGTVGQEVTSGRRGTTGTTYSDAAEQHATAERDVQATQDVPGEASGKKVFGRDIFNQRALSFSPNLNVPTPTDYVLGAGDQIVIDIYGDSQKTIVHTVSAEGTVTIDGVGPVSVSGMTVAAAQQKLRSQVGRHYSGSSLRLTVGSTRSIMVNVMGEVNTPGTYHLSPFATAFHALYAAGGIGELGTLRNIKVFRRGKLVTVIDIYEYILNGRLAGNVRLQDDDVIQVGPYECLVGITGNVKRPMFYEMRRDESVGTLIRYAGGFTGEAYKKSVRLTRKAGDFYTVHNVDEFSMSTFKVDDGDAITVEGMLNRYENMVEVKGAVFRPGQFNLNGQVSSVRSLIEAASGLTEDAFAQHAIIHRLKADRSLEIVPVDVQGIMSGLVPDVPLQNEDVLFVPTQEELRKERILTITGEVMTPGDYEYADNTTIQDLIVQAGGLTDGASLARVDVSRRIDNPYSKEKGRQIAETFTFDIKDGLVLNQENRSFLLKPYDVVHVRRSPGYVMPKNITVSGEVNFEGSFTLEKKNLRLSDAIRMAGGVTPDAYVHGARLLRVMNQEERVRKQAVLDALQNSVTGKDSIVWNKIQMDSTYVIGIELDKALAEPGGDYDVVLRENDRIDVPEYNGTVRISGDVQFPNTVTFVKGKSYKWYIDRAGGFSETAKRRKAFIVYPNGMMAKLSSGTRVEPGSEIVVPTKKRKSWKMSEFMGLGSIISSLASTAAMITYLTRK